MKPTTFVSTILHGGPRDPRVLPFPGTRPVGQPHVEPVRVERRPDGRLWATCGRRAGAVTVRRCFPWSEPSRFISLRDDEDDELALVADLAALDRRSRGVLEEALAEAGFVLEIVRLRDVDEEVEIRTWDVETRQGPRRFQTRLDDWPREVPAGGVLIRDVAGDLYYVREPGQLDARSQALLWAFVD